MQNIKINFVPHTREICQALWQSGAPLQAFYGPRHYIQGFLSQHSTMFPFFVDGHYYPTAEHYMMTQKALRYKSSFAVEMIKAARSPSRVREIGRRFIPDFDEADWVKVRREIVTVGNYYKFTSNAEAIARIHGTGNSILVEASPSDTVWGIGCNEDRAHGIQPINWPGENLLGLALMDVRSMIRQQLNTQEAKK